MAWLPFNNGRSIGERGSGSGIVIRDEEHTGGARITIERGGSIAPYSITCGIYGWTFHTRFFGSEQEAQRDCDLMRIDVEHILVAIPLNTDADVERKTQLVAKCISEFVERFP